MMRVGICIFALSMCLLDMHVFASADMQYVSTYMLTAQMLPDLIRDEYNTLVFERKNPQVAKSSMKVLGLHAVVDKSKVFQLTSSGLKEVQNLDEVSVRKLHKNRRTEILPRESKKLSGEWGDAEETGQSSDGNILGAYEIFYTYTPETEFIIPVIDIASDISGAERDLAYYGAELVKEGEFIRFPEDRRFPIWAMSIDSNYVRDCFHVSPECGEYLEWHSDRPHWHHAIRSGGFYILGRSLSEKNHDIRLTGFRIPKGYAVYTQGGVIHSDAHLVGKWFVGYDKAEHYSTALLKTRKYEQVRISTLLNFRSLHL